MNRFRFTTNAVVTLTFCLVISGCSTHKNPLLTPDGLSGVRTYFEVMGDDTTIPCMNYFADNSKSGMLNTSISKSCNEQFTSAYLSLRRSHPEFMQNVKTSDFFDPLFWQTYLGINK